MCRVENCDTKKIVARGLCSKHYKRWYKGIPLDASDRQPAILEKTHPFYVAWVNMKTRCDNPKSTQYKWYGARGIHYCEEWTSFKAFYDDMFSVWSPGRILDRIDNDGDYNYENCRWVTPKISANNRRARGTAT